MSGVESALRLLSYYPVLIHNHTTNELRYNMSDVDYHSPQIAYTCSPSKSLQEILSKLQGSAVNRIILNTTATTASGFTATGIAGTTIDSSITDNTNTKEYSKYSLLSTSTDGMDMTPGTQLWDERHISIPHYNLPYNPNPNPNANPSHNPIHKYGYTIPPTSLNPSCTSNYQHRSLHTPSISVSAPAPAPLQTGFIITSQTTVSTTMRQRKMLGTSYIEQKLPHIDDSIIITDTSLYNNDNNDNNDTRINIHLNNESTINWFPMN